jgi:hypothetical protein
MTGRELEPYRRGPDVPGGQRDALREYLDHARSWERLPSLVDRDLLRLSAAASAVSIALGLAGLMVGSSQPPRGFFLVGAATILGFMRFALGASGVLLLIGGVGLCTCLVALVRPAGMATRVVLAGELVAAGVAGSADVILILAFALQVLLWFVLITLAIALTVAILAVVGAASGG